jgi:hypothetical protein
VKTYTETRRVVIKDAGRYFGDGDHGSDRPTLEAVIEITVDLDAIANGSMARRAVLSKGKRSIDGHVMVRAHSVARAQP